MEIHDFAPGKLLKPFIKTYKIIESRYELINRVLPSTSVVMAFRYRGQVNYLKEGNREPLPGTTISGLRKSVRLINYLENSATLLVVFEEAGQQLFLKSLCMSYSNTAYPWIV